MFENTVWVWKLVEKQNFSGIFKRVFKSAERLKRTKTGVSLLKKCGMICFLILNIAISHADDYMLPENHLLIKPLHEIFSQSRAILNIKSMENAGFYPIQPRKFTRLIVTSHPKTPGYIYKIYLDCQRYYKGQTELSIWKQRIDGAELIRALIKQNGWEHLFKVPHKWVYKLPEKPAPPKEFLRKDYILVEDDMNLLSEEENALAWKNSYFVTQELLIALHHILKELGLRDCAKIDNIPFSTDGRIAFIDTETFNETVQFKKLSGSIPEELKTFWKNLK